MAQYFIETDGGTLTVTVHDARRVNVQSEALEVGRGAVLRVNLHLYWRAEPEQLRGRKIPAGWSFVPFGEWFGHFYGGRVDRRDLEPSDAQKQRALDIVRLAVSDWLEAHPEVLREADDAARDAAIKERRTTLARLGLLRAVLQEEIAALEAGGRAVTVEYDHPSGSRSSCTRVLHADGESLTPERVEVNVYGTVPYPIEGTGHERSRTIKG